jgi:hypothetical protein
MKIAKIIQKVILISVSPRYPGSEHELYLSKALHAV